MGDASKQEHFCILHLTKLEKEECEEDDDDDHTTGQAALGFVGYDDKDCAPMTVIATATSTCPFAKQRRTDHAAAASSKGSCSKKESKSRFDSFNA